MRAVLALLLLAALWPNPARAEWVSARGERVFPAEVSEAEACRNAEERAKEEAVRHITGERFSSEELMVCTEQGGQADCSHNSAVWSMVDGDVRAVRGRQVETSAVVEGVRRCVVSLEADVMVARGKPDPGFDLSVAVSASVLRDGEPLEISLTPSQPMSVAVFQWLPYESGTAQVSRIFPNPFDTVARIDRPTTIPTLAGRQRYGLKVGFPAAIGRSMVDEYLMVVATRRPVEFRESYSLDDFRARLIELPRGDSRIVRKAYSILRRER
jgi:hypothetical protein